MDLADFQLRIVSFQLLTELIQHGFRKVNHSYISAQFSRLYGVQSMSHTGKQDPVALFDVVLVDHGDLAVMDGTAAVQIAQEIIEGTDDPVFVLFLSGIHSGFFAFFRVVHSNLHFGFRPL